MRLRPNHNATKKKFPIYFPDERRKNARYLDGDPFIKISTSVTAEMKWLVVQRAVQKQQTLSQYIRELVINEITVEKLKV